MDRPTYELHNLNFSGDDDGVIIACNGCASHALQMVHGAFSVAGPRGHACELRYEGICTDTGEEVTEP